MGKRSSTATGAAAGSAVKKAKTAYADTPTMGNWVQTKFLEKELQSAEKIAILKNEPAEVLIAGPEIILRPPTGFQVLFLAFLLRGFSFPPHPFLCGLLFACGIQLHDPNPNNILHIACFITLCECFLYDFIGLDFLVTFRSSIEETSRILGDRDRFHVWPHDATLEQTADSQERSHEDAALKDLLKLLPPSKKSTVKPNLIPVTSFDGPSEPNRHVSLVSLFCTYRVLPISSPRG
jgi:hypothetical protein